MQVRYPPFYAVPIEQIEIHKYIVCLFTHKPWFIYTKFLITITILLIEMPQDSPGIKHSVQHRFV